MSIRFAGSRCLDERRRRRLATDSEELLSAKPSSHSKNRSDSSHEPQTLLNKTQTPLKSLISPNIWKLWAMASFSLILGGTLLAADWYASAQSQDAAPLLLELFSLQNGKVSAYFAALLLTAAGQLAALIWWFRSRSWYDFAGHYRHWAWIAAIWVFLGFCVATNAHRAFTETILWLRPEWEITIPALYWLGPAAILTLPLLGILRREMYDSRISQTLFHLAVGCYFLSALSRLDLSILPQGQENLLAQKGMALTGHLCIAFSMLFHARHVIYVSAEPTQATPLKLHLRLLGLLRNTFRALIGIASRLGKLCITFLTPALGKKQKKKENSETPAGDSPKHEAAQDESEKAPASSPPEEKQQQAPADESNQPSASSKKTQSKRKKSPSRPKAKRKMQAEPSPKTEPQTADDADKKEESTSESTIKEKSQSTRNTQKQEQSETRTRVDQPISQDELKGLSKKERRRLRKQKRQQQKAAKSRQA